MKSSSLIAFLSKASACAEEMFANAEYIMRELPVLTVTDAQRAAIQELCAAFARTKHAVASEVVEVSGLDEAPESPVVQERVRRIMRGLREHLPRLDAVVVSLDPQRPLVAQDDAVFVLLAESGGNVLHAFVRAQEAAERYFAAIGDGTFGGMPPDPD